MLFKAAALLLLLSAIPSGASAMSVADARGRVVSGTMEYLNVPYLWGGTHSGTGMDCSGFTMNVFSDAGFELPRNSRAQYAASRRIKPDEVLPGDLIFFAMKNPGTAMVDHVGIYVGKGYFVHAGVSTGVHINSVSEPYYFSRLISVRRYSGF